MSNVDKVVGTLPMNITTYTVIKAAREIVYRKIPLGGTLAVAQARRIFYNQMFQKTILNQIVTRQTKHPKGRLY